ncbi:MAG: iron ABC transporter permease [Pyramidobacter sp.]|nr:iron ABC transporter permease [Pyramidobacter sp.]
MKVRWNFWKTITVIIFALFAVFLVAPLLSLFVSAFKDADTGGWTIGNFASFFTKKYYYRTLFRSLAVSSCVTLAAVALGAPVAYFMSCYHIRAKRFVQILIIISMLSPSFIGAYSWVLLLGRSGVVTQFFAALGIKTPSIYGFFGIVLVLALKLYPFIFMYVSGAMKKLDPSLLEASQSLGCGPARNVVGMVIPLILPTVLAGSLLVFMSSLADFGTPMLIGEGFRVMPVLVYREFMGEMGGNANFAAAIAVVMVSVTTSIYLTQRWIVNRLSFKSRSVRRIVPKEIEHRGKSLLIHAWIYLVAFLGILPQATVVYTSFLKTNGPTFVPGFSLESYRAIFSEMGASIINTYCYGGLGICGIVVLAFLMAYLSVRRRNALTSLLDLCSIFPYVISGSVLGIMLLMAFNKPPLALSGTAAIIVISFIIRRLPHTLRSSVAILHQISKSSEEAAISLGASPLRSFLDVTARLMLPGVMTGATLSWVAVINELSSSIILYTGATKTMSVAIYSEVQSASYGTAAALATVLTGTTVLSLLILFSLSGKREVSF